MGTTTWVPNAEGTGRGVEALPYGVYSTAEDPHPRVGVAIGEAVLDVAAVLDRGAPDGAEALDADTLNPFLATGRSAWSTTRAWLVDLLTDADHRAPVEPHLVPREAAQMHLPFAVADYVDFYSSEHHATNVGRIFRPDGEPLPAAWKHLPIGYHGRSATVVASGTPITRPCGQRAGEDGPSFGPSQRLDVEAEVGFVVGVGNRLGEPIAVGAFREHVFGLCLVNDWSARDIQAFETVPLGPFLGKSFATSVSPWVVPLEALEASRVPSPARDPEPAAYLREAEPNGYALDLEVDWNGTVVSRPPFATMYWTAAQQLAHLTVNGAAVRTGDLYASGTVSGPEPDQLGCFLELTRNGATPVRLADGQDRTFLEDGDTVVIRGTAPGAGGTRIDLGEVTGSVAPARC